MPTPHKVSNYQSFHRFYHESFHKQHKYYSNTCGGFSVHAYKRVRNHHLSRSGILQPIHSPWRHLYDNGDQGSFISGFSRVVLKKCTNTWSSCTTNWSSKIIEFSGWDWSNTFLFWIINVSIWNAFLITNVLHDIGEFKICVDQGFPRFGINWTDF